MAITNLNPQLWIRIYTGFDIKPNLRQTGIAKNMATFGTKNSCEFLTKSSC